MIEKLRNSGLAAILSAFLTSACSSKPAVEPDSGYDAYSGYDASIPNEPYVEHVTSENFNEKVLNAEEPVILEFWHPQCSWCLQFRLPYKELSAEYRGRMLFADYNILPDMDKEESIPKTYGVEGVPAFRFFNEGYEFPEHRINGIIPIWEFKDRIDDFLEEVEKE